MAVYLGNRLVLANGVAGTSLVNGHGSTHAAGGGDEITPASIGAAEAQHTHGEYAPKPVSMTVSLPVAGWTEYTYSCSQAVNVPGMRSGKFVLVSPVPLSWNAYVGANIRCTVQSYNVLAFSADKLPTEDISVNLLFWG